MAATKQAQAKPQRRTAEAIAAEGGEYEQVTLHLAHPIGPKYQAGLGLDPKPEGGKYLVGEEISVTRNVARAVINAGFAQVDPENPQAVADALGISDADARKVVAEMAGGGTQSPDSPATG